jgi:hypothetical protein
MAEVKTGKSPDLFEVKVSDILGLWEVIRIDIGGEVNIYPWIRGRFMFNFLEEKVFVCIKEGKHSSGTWELTKKTWESETLFTIKLNDAFEYIIMDLDEDEMKITDRASKYFLSRKL